MKYTSSLMESKHGFQALLVVGVLFHAVSLTGCASSNAGKSDDGPIQLGWTSRSVLFDPRYQEFCTRFDTVAVATEFVELMKILQPDVEVVVFFGTWCGDSRREVPHLMKIMDAVGIDSSKVSLYGLDRSKKSLDGVTAEYSVEKVPTFIFLRDGVEIGRVAEKPVESGGRSPHDSRGCCKEIVLSPVVPTYCEIPPPNLR